MTSGIFTDSLTVVVLDRRVPYLSEAANDVSLLTMPLGDRSVFEHVTAGLDAWGAGNRQLIVAPGFVPGAEYEVMLKRCSPSTARVVPQDRLGTILTERESSDDMLIVDPRYWPAGGYGLASLRSDHGDYRGVTHVVAVGADLEGTHEWVEHDADGRVRGVPRFYDRINWPQVASSRVCLTLVAARLVGPPPRFSSLSELRSELVQRGMLSRDVALRQNVYDLCDAYDLLALNDRVLAEGQQPPCREEYTRRAPGVWIGPECQIDSQVRMVPPVVIHARSQIDEGATVIGPTVVGYGSTIGRGAVVAQSVLAPRAVVPPGSTVQERVFSTEGPVTPAALGAPVHLNGNSHAVDSAFYHGPAARFVPRLAADGLGDAAVKGYAVATRMLNLLIAGLGLLILAPLGLILAALIKLDSRGPVLFGHVREGKAGRTFRCWKFRTMTADAHCRQRAMYSKNEVDGPQFKLRDDPRVTRIGRILRDTNLDELPQLFNVLMGEMNLVGPRPSPFRENQICVPWRRARLSVRPGITGLWQVCRNRRFGSDFDQWIFYDMEYVRHLSVVLDLKILMATAITFGGRWNVPLDWLIAPKKGAAPATPTRAAAKSNRDAALPAASVILALLVGLAGCHDPRIGLSEFLAMQESVSGAGCDQTTKPAGSVMADRAMAPYRVGPSDVLGVVLTGTDLAATFPIIQARVDRDGTIELPMVGPVKVLDMEIEDVEDAIRNAYVPKVLKDLAVHAQVASADTTQVLVVGAVAYPGLVKLRRAERNLLFAITAAGGVSQDSSGKAQLKRIRRPDEEVTLDLTNPVELDAALALHPLENGDIVTILPAQPNTVFVGGLVNLPRPQAYPPGVEVTVLQAIAASGGLRTDVTPREATLIRRKPDGSDVHVKIDLDRMTTARDPNITLAAGDILWVPETIETRVQDWINRNIYIRAGASVHYDVSGIEYMNRQSQQSQGLGGGGGGGGLQDSFDPFGFLNQNAALQNINNRPPVQP